MKRAESAAKVALLTEVDPATLTVAEVIDGVAAITASTRDGRVVMVWMPALKPSTPSRIRRLWLDRAEANLTGRCPRCDGVAGSSDTGFSMGHDGDCRVGDEDAFARHVDPTGHRLVHAALLRGAS